MEIKQYLKILKVNYLLILGISITSTLLFGLLYFLLPTNFIAEGTLYAFPVSGTKQPSEVSNELNYARNLIALSNSPEFKKSLQDKDLSDVTFTPLVGVVGGIKLKEVSPNILTLTVTESSKEKALKKFNNYLQTLIDFSKFLNKGNSSFEIQPLNESPIISSNSKNINQFLVLGFISGVFISVIYLYFKKI